MMGMYTVHVHVVYLVYVEDDGYVHCTWHVVYLVYVEDDGYVQCTCTCSIPSICREWWVCTVYMHM